ncbi:MAG: class I mannose-6-phosphate isomerase [Phycisphaeraceae bacterium]|nr:class I mannose-6-phosphate isomerase [Phycisphaeraceae bacterium]
MSPLRFHPILVPRVWGGTRLSRWGRPQPPGTVIGESWEIADLPDEVAGGRSVVAEGPLAGRTLRALVDGDPSGLLGAAARWPGGGFPLLVKLLDATENLSVQVHPSPAWAAAHPDAHLKSEAWVVLDAVPGSVLYAGLKPGISRRRFAEAVVEQAVPDILERFDARPGLCVYLPSGICHALGGGILVAEVQTPSDTTYRIFDWHRAGRALHVAEALACIDLAARPVIGPIGSAFEVGALRTEVLARCDYFVIHRIESRQAAVYEIETENRPVILLLVAGEGTLTTESCGDSTLRLTRGTVVLLPASVRDGTLHLSAGTALLEIRVPVPTGNLLA